jgi:hypothetical protein
MTCVHIRALIDNTTAVTYIHKMGGMKENLNELTREILVDCPRILPIIQKLVTLPFQKSQKHLLLQKLHLTVFKLSGTRLKTKAYQNQLSTSFCNHGEIQQRNNIGLISKDGCDFALKNRLIPCHHI